MLYRDFGNTGLKVSRLCFGTLTIGPLQKGLTVKEGADLLSAAYERGVNFYDTAEYYGTYGIIRAALRKKADVVVAAKSYAYDAAGAQKSLEKYLRESGRERAEVFLLHEQESVHTVRGHFEALRYYIRKKEEGLIGAVGLSTHRVSGVKAALMYPEIEVVHPMLNYTGMGIADGTREDMEQAVASVYRAGKAVYGMKALAGGNLIEERESAFAYIRGLDCLHSVAVGMQNLDEIEYNTRYFGNKEADAALLGRLKSQKRSIIIDEYCIACGNCVEICKQHALLLEGDKITVDRGKCVLCGYCARACKNFAIKII